MINSKVQLDSSHHTLPLKMTNKKERSVFTERNINGDKVFLGRRMKTFITALMKRKLNKHTCLSLMGKFGLIWAKIVDICCTHNEQEPQKLGG